MSPLKRKQIFWFVALYVGSLVAYAMIAGAERSLLKLIH